MYFIKAKTFLSTFSVQVRTDTLETGKTHISEPEFPFFTNYLHVSQTVGELVLSGSWISLCVSLYTLCNQLWVMCCEACFSNWISLFNSNLGQWSLNVITYRLIFDPKMPQSIHLRMVPRR